MAIDRKHLDRLDHWSANGVDVVVVRVASVKGSTPRDEDAAMSVTASDMAGTIGGGQLEWLALTHARDILAGEAEPGIRDIPLGPEIGQCCGGRVKLEFSRLDAEGLDALSREADASERELPRAFIFGAGHTGRALAAALAPLPLATKLVDTRPEVFEDFALPAETVATALPEEIVHTAPPESAFVTMTHEHSLDFLVTAEALKRGDAAYVGMIGSATKRAVFLSWLEDNDYGRSLGEKLVCPIGGSAVKDKRPEVIAALTAAEILTALQAGQDGTSSGKGRN